MEGYWVQGCVTLLVLGCILAVAFPADSAKTQPLKVMREQMVAPLWTHVCSAAAGVFLAAPRVPRDLSGQWPEQ